MTITSSGLGSKAIKTFALLDQIVTVLGGTTQSFWPFIQATCTTLANYGSGSDSNSLNTDASVESLHDPSQHPGGVYSYKNDGVVAWMYAAADIDAHSFGNGTVDVPFSAGMWLLVEEALGTARSILSKYRSTAVTAREYDFRFGTDGKLVMELYDESAAASEIATSAGAALTPFIWQFVTMTYDGGETAPVVNLYINAASVHDGTTAETGAYVAMEDLTESFAIGDRNTAAAAAQIFQGRVALPFITGKALTAAEVAALYGLGQQLLGLV